ncbi:MAG: hypothetical protein M1828_004465 [Chrysothrix sp. TS-e1954]|nr:MAG: hypothetical protein M1828_004465 [Chrysothrix sp. TS-e1954]
MLTSGARSSTSRQHLRFIPSQPGQLRNSELSHLTQHLTDRTRPWYSCHWCLLHSYNRVEPTFASTAKVPGPSEPPPFSSLHFPPNSPFSHLHKETSFETQLDDPPAFTSSPPFEESASSASSPEAETKAALPKDTKVNSQVKDVDDGEPPPPYTEGYSPLESFTYVMAAAGGAASIITQVSAGNGPGVLGPLGGITSEESVTLELRGTRFALSRDELLTLPEFVLLSLFPNGLLPDGQMGGFHEGDVYAVDVSGSITIVHCSSSPLAVVSEFSNTKYAGILRSQLGNRDFHAPCMLTYYNQYDPASLQYMLEFFRNVAQSMPSRSPSPSNADANDAISVDPMPGSAQQMLQDRAGIIVLREDLDYYVIPPKKDIEQPEMVAIKRAAGNALLEQDGIFSGLRKSEEAGSTEQHLIEMLTAGGFNHSDRWGHRAGEPNKAVICSIALAKLRTEIRNADTGGSNNAVGMAQKLLLFWRKPARRCWWEGVELTGVQGVDGPLKIWVRRVWTLEMSVIGLR